MIIKIDDYRLVQEGTLFNLIWVTKSEETLIKKIDGKRVRVKTGNLIDREVIIGYGLQFDNCINRIIMNNLSNKDLVVELKEWIKMYREEREKITKLINI